jgi:hypothetical protein
VEAGKKAVGQALAAPDRVLATRPADFHVLLSTAAKLDAADAIAPLVALLEAANAGTLPPRARPVVQEVIRTLAAMRATAAVPALSAMVRRRDDSWGAAVEALGRLDGGAMLAYARELAPTVGSDDGPRTDLEMRLVARAAREHEARDLLPFLQRWMEHAHRDGLLAELAHARLALDDPTMRKQRRALAVRGGVVPAGVAGYVAGLGGSDEDIPALLRFAASSGQEATAAYEAMSRMLPPSGRGSAPARARLRAGLEAGTALRENTASPNFGPRLLAQHHGVLFALGRVASGRRLVELTAGTAESAATWEAARWAVQYQAPGADDTVAALLARAADRDQPRREDPDLVLELLDALASSWGRRDPRWALFLLAPHPDVRAAAVARFVRERPAACEVVATAARRAGDDAVQDALLALTALGGSCRDALRGLLGDAAAPTAARGTALEVLTMLGGASPSDAATLPDAGPTRAYRVRAAQIAALATKP